jgi:chemotaxis signal transduction protein
MESRLFAISAANIRQMVMMPEVTAVPGLPPFIQGVITLRGDVIPLINLRVRIGMASAQDETDRFCTLMDAREQEHRKWLDELQRSIATGSVFTLATDPHQCAFGRWYDSYRPPDPWIGGLVKKFEQPHAQIHALAIEVKKLQDHGDSTGAARLVSGAGKVLLATMIRLFDEIKTTVRQSRRQTVLILNVQDRSVAVAVDSAIAVEKLQVEDLPAGPTDTHGGLVRRLGKRAKTSDLVLVLEPDRILDAKPAAPAASPRRRPAKLRL